MMFWWGFYLEDFSGGEAGKINFHPVYFALSFWGYSLLQCENKENI